MESIVRGVFVRFHTGGLYYWRFSTVLFLASSPLRRGSQVVTTNTNSTNKRTSRRTERPGQRRNIRNTNCCAVGYGGMVMLYIWVPKPDAYSSAKQAEFTSLCISLEQQGLERRRQQKRETKGNIKWRLKKSIKWESRKQVCSKQLTFIRQVVYCEVGRNGAGDVDDYTANSQTLLLLLQEPSPLPWSSEQVKKQTSQESTATNQCLSLSAPTFCHLQARFIKLEPAKLTM